MGASSGALAAVGIAPEAAKLIGDIIGSQTLTGTTQATAAPLIGSVCIVTAAASQTGGILPQHNPGRTQEVTNTSSTSAVIYPPVGGQVNGLSANTGITIPANKSCIFRCISLSNTGVSSYNANLSA